MTAFGATAGASGNIFVEAGVYIEDVTINGVSNLTGIIGAGGLNSATTLDGYFIISNMTNDFTLSGFDIWDWDNSGDDNTGVYAGSNTGTLTLEDLWVENEHDIGITVFQIGDVFVNNVDSSYNDGPGAIIFATGDVDVQNSSFDNNNYFGLGVVSEEGAVTITNSEFNNNEREGLIVETGEGDITLENVTANGNGFGYAGEVLPSVSDPFEDIYGSGIVLMTGSGWSTTSVSAANVVPGGKITLNNVIASGNWGNGVSILSGGDASVICGTFENNGKYGVSADLPGTLTDDSNTYNGNASGAGLIIGGTVVQKSSGCGGGGGENGKKPVIVPYLPQVIAVLTLLTDADLPGALPDGKTFVADMSVKLMLAGEEIEEWPAGVQVSFDIPAGMEPPFTVLSWNGTAWVEIPSAVVDGKVVFTVTGPGIFVLVSP